MLLVVISSPDKSYNYICPPKKQNPPPTNQPNIPLCSLFLPGHNFQSDLMEKIPSINFILFFFYGDVPLWYMVFSCESQGKKNHHHPLHTSHHLQNPPKGETKFIFIWGKIYKKKIIDFESIYSSACIVIFIYFFVLPKISLPFCVSHSIQLSSTPPHIITITTIFSI